ncbi:MAG: hypothetical protein KatS3mg103_0721 [Phycisphaerales bacterium]|nr:MAG: hypothetical protein KatS3mg103_0721 [Phycisphaerales bacterium]
MVCIGVFDGVHLGHRSLIERARHLADRLGPAARVVAMAFDPSPKAVLNPGSAPPRLSSLGDRVAWLRQAGADEVVHLVPTADLLGRSAEWFVDHLLMPLRPAAVVEGPDFRFGAGRSADVHTLADLGRQRGFAVHVVPPVEVALHDQMIVPASSTRVRWLLNHGRVADAAVVLGRGYELVGTVQRGDRRGRAIGFPTANLPASTMLPADGVYACRATLPDGRVLPAAANVGDRPTVDGRRRRVEAHLIGYRPPAGQPEYGWPMRLEFVSWLRDQVRFASVDDLADQLRRDVARAERVLSLRRSPPKRTGRRAGGRPGRPSDGPEREHPGSPRMTHAAEQTAYDSTIGPQELARWIRSADRLLLITHVRPDGDAVGSTLAIARSVRLEGASAQLAYAGELPPWMDQVLGSTPWVHLDAGDPPAPFDRCLVCDTGAWGQLEPYKPWIAGRAEQMAILDHHRSGMPDLAEARWVQPQAAAACEMAATVCVHLLGLDSPADLPKEVAEPLLLGLGTDTGWFRHPSVTPAVLRLAADLIQAGAPHAQLVRTTMLSDPPQRLRLLARAMANLTLHEQLGAAIMTITAKDLAETDATPGMASGFADPALAVRSIDVARRAPGAARGRHGPADRQDQPAVQDRRAGRLGPGRRLRRGRPRPRRRGTQRAAPRTDQGQGARADRPGQEQERPISDQPPGLGARRPHRPQAPHAERAFERASRGSRRRRQGSATSRTGGS